MPFAASLQVSLDTPVAYVGETTSGQGDIGSQIAFLTKKAFCERSGLAGESSASWFSRLRSDIDQLLRAPQEDEFGLVRPSQSAVSEVTKILFPLAQGGVEIPAAADVGTDHDGDIRIVWENGPRFLELVVPYDNAAAGYFYHSEGDHYDLQRDFSLRAVRSRFAWLEGKR
jgi:hypothetical protein